jgi:hypothetical protein
MIVQAKKYLPEMAVEVEYDDLPDRNGGFGGITLWIVNHGSPETIASLRYMALLPARARREPVARFAAGMCEAAFLDHWRPRTLVLTKAFEPAVVALALAARRRSIRVIVVLCDDRSAWPHYQELDRALAGLADNVVVQTEAMARHVLDTFGRASTIIEEPYEVPAAAPRFNPGSRIKLLWYGRSSNHDTLCPGILPLVDDPDVRFDLTVVTDRLSPDLMALARRVSGSDSGCLTIREWSLSCQAEALSRTDLVLIPSLDRQDKHVKGHNRLTESISAGVPALVYSLPAYQELSEFCWCGEDLRVGLRWALAHRQSLLDRVLQGQSYVARRFSIDRIAACWQRLFDGDPSGAGPAAPASPEADGCPASPPFSNP